MANRILSLIELEMRDLKGRLAAPGCLILFLSLGSFLRSYLEATYRPLASTQPAMEIFIDRGFTMNILLWSAMTALLLVFESLPNQRGNPDWEPILATGMTDWEILWGKISVPCAGGAISGMVGLGFLFLIRTWGFALPVPDPFPTLLLLLLSLPPVSLLITALANLGALRFRSSAPLVFLAILPGGLILAGVREWLIRSRSWPHLLSFSIWVLLWLLALGTLRLAVVRMDRDRLVSRL